MNTRKQTYVFTTEDGVYSLFSNGIDWTLVKVFVYRGEHHTVTTYVDSWTINTKKGVCYLKMSINGETTTIPFINKEVR